MDKILEMRQKRAALVAQARQLLDKAEEEKRGLTAEEEQMYDRIMSDVDKLGKDIEREERLLEIEKQMAQSGGIKAAKQDQPGGDSVDIRTGRASEEYRSAFWKAMRHTRNALYADEVRALQIGTDSEGGYLVPDEFERTLVQALENQNVMRTLATVITTGSGDRLIPVVASHGSASWIAEEGAFSESDEAFSRVALGAHKVGTLIKVSEELLQDSAFNLEQYIASEFARRIGRAEEAAFVNGDGSGKPSGVIGSAQVGVTAAATNAITADEIIDLYHSLGRPYRQRAAFLMADATAKVIRKLKDNDGQYIWQPGLQSGQPDRLLGRPVAISDDVSTIAASAKVIAFGDFSYYWIADRQGTVFQRLNELYAVNGQVGFRAYRRVDGKLILTEAVKVLQMAAA
ncbi:phage major capsid protein [Thermosyntropha sp.]|uniref:phage major capsid protein n=1 Tax=Thermosyntropha sp. TaxID=2740820 RepID=UPI0025EBB264|nr:phage major capsid protein [Thermosyntropha sp.]MBO8158835.1 phage major capsid protein [Thermosyntropha sp.]